MNAYFSFFNVVVSSIIRKRDIVGYLLLSP